MKIRRHLRLATKTTAIALLVGSTATSQAAILTSFVQNANSSDTAAQDAEAAFLASLHRGAVTESFDDFGDVTPVVTGSQQTSWVQTAPSFSTAVGAFTNLMSGAGGDPEKPHNLMIESRETGEFGREVLASSSTDLWLDSNDARIVAWDFSGFDDRFDAFGFYIADAVDQGAELTLHFAGGSTDTVLLDPFTPLSGEPNGNLGYFSVRTEFSLLGASLSFLNSMDRDGWGIDDVTVGRVPEPGALGLLGLALAGFGGLRRRRA